MPYLWIPLVFLPLAEIITFVMVAGEIGVFGALALCIAAAMLGFYLLQKQSWENFMRGQIALREGKMPYRDMFNGLCVVLAGLLFIIPGFLSDLAAIILLLPDMREKLRGFLSPRMDRTPGDPDIIEGEYERVDPKRDRLHR